MWRNIQMAAGFVLLVLQVASAASVSEIFSKSVGQPGGPVMPGLKGQSGDHNEAFSNIPADAFSLDDLANTGSSSGKRDLQNDALKTWDLVDPAWDSNKSPSDKLSQNTWDTLINAWNPSQTAVDSNYIAPDAWNPSLASYNPVKNSNSLLSAQHPAYKTLAAVKKAWDASGHSDVPLNIKPNPSEFGSMMNVDLNKVEESLNKELGKPSGSAFNQGGQGGTSQYVVSKASSASALSGSKYQWQELLNECERVTSTGAATDPILAALCRKITGFAQGGAPQAATTQAAAIMFWPPEDSKGGSNQVGSAVASVQVGTPVGNSQNKIPSLAEACEWLAHHQNSLAPSERAELMETCRHVSVAAPPSIARRDDDEYDHDDDPSVDV